MHGPKELLTVSNTDVESLCSHPIDKVHSLVQNHTHCITVPHVQVAIKKLKAAKSDCTDHLVSDHLINGTDRLFTLISLLFTCMLSHGVSPLGLLCSTMAQLPKRSVEVKVIKNYRATATSRILGELFNSLILCILLYKKR